MAGFIQNQPAPYMDVNTLWSDRREPHANPLSTEPRRSIPRPTDASKELTPLLSFLYHPGTTGRD